MGGRVRTRLDGPDPVDVATLKGANMSLRRAALQSAGPFDVGFAGTALLEDADLSTRVRRAGWRLVYEPDAAVDHEHAPHGGVRTRSDGLASSWWRLHNTARFVRRHGGRGAWPRLWATQSAIAVRDALRHRRPGAVWHLVGALTVGWRSGGTPASGYPGAREGA